MGPKNLQASVLLTSSWAMPMLLVHGPHFTSHWRGTHDILFDPFCRHVVSFNSCQGRQVMHPIGQMRQRGQREVHCPNYKAGEYWHQNPKKSPNFKHPYLSRRQGCVDGCPFLWHSASSRPPFFPQHNKLILVLRPDFVLSVSSVLRASQHSNANSNTTSSKKPSMITQAKEALQSHWLSHLCHLNLPSDLTLPSFIPFTALVMTCNYLVHVLLIHLLSTCPRHHIRNCSQLILSAGHLINNTRYADSQNE